MLTDVEVDPLLYLVMSYILTDMLTDVEVDLTDLLHVQVVGHNNIQTLNKRKYTVVLILLILFKTKFKGIVSRAIYFVKDL
jgi:hypothetical protein